jgi:TolA-binding protein
MTTMRPLLLAFCFGSIALSSVNPLLMGADQPVPTATLPPTSRPLQLKESKHSSTPVSSTTDNNSVLDDLAALKRAVERVKNNTQTNSVEDPQKNNHHTESLAHPHDASATDGKLLTSTRFGEKNLSVFISGTGESFVSAAIDREAVEVIYRELGQLLGRSIDDTRVIANRRAVSLYVKDVPWAEACDRLLGQVGLGWREDGGSTGTLVIYDTGMQQRDSEQLLDLAKRALNHAIKENQNATGAEAMYLLGQQAAAARRPLEAINLYSLLADTYGKDGDPVIQVWVNKGILGIGEAMMDVEQFQDARSVFLNYISKADLHDPALPDAYLSAANAARRQGLANNDPLALDSAIDTLQNLLDAFANVTSAKASVHMARVTLGELLFEAARYREAETQLKLVLQANGKKDNDLLNFRLAECAFHDGRSAEAMPTYERLWSTFRTQTADPHAPATIYPVSAYRVGQCYLSGSPPKYVEALFSFMRARQEFNASTLDAEMLISIARCYSELERDDDTINTLWELLRGDTLKDNRPGQLQLDQLLGELESRLSSYAGPIRAKALFYIAQADYRRALRDRRQRTTAAADAVHHFERTIAEKPPRELLHAAQLGLARSALIGGQESIGEQTLRNLLEDPLLSLRDRDYASNLLGTYLREQGRLREAIRAFQGKVD